MTNEMKVALAMAVEANGITYNAARALVMLEKMVTLQGIPPEVLDASLRLFPDNLADELTSRFNDWLKATGNEVGGLDGFGDGPEPEGSADEVAGVFSTPGGDTEEAALTTGEVGLSGESTPEGPAGDKVAGPVA